MARIFVTGSADGLGLATARTLQAQSHDVVVHLRSPQRLPAVQDVIEHGGAFVVGDLADDRQTKDVAAQVNRLGSMDVVIHNAGVYSGPAVLPVNVVAPYLLTVLIEHPRRLIYLSSGMHRGGHAVLDGMDWSGRSVTGSYSDSKLFVTALSAAIARLCPGIFCNSVDPGWVPTKMGGPNAPDDLRLGHLTQEWLAVSDAAEARTSGGHWHHQRLVEPHPAARDPDFQDRLIAALAGHTGIALP